MSWLKNFWRQLPTRAKIGAVLLGIFILAGIIGPLVAPYAPAYQNPSPSLSLKPPVGPVPARHHADRPGRALPAPDRHPADA